MSSAVPSLPHHPHDAFFKEIFADPAHARELIQAHAPPDLVALLDLDTLEQFDTSFIDEDLRQHFADLAFKVNLKQGNTAYICLLLEHKSYPDKWVLLQLLRYELQVWENARKQDEQALPAVFPMVVYHGKRKWHVAQHFAQLFRLADLQPVARYVPQFEYHLFDLNALDDDKLTEAGLVNAALGAMKHIFSAEMQLQLGRILRRLRGLPREKMLRYVQIVLRYVMTSATQLSRDQFERTIQEEFTDKQTQEGAMTIAQQLFLEGEIHGKQVGLIEGKQVGLIEGKQAGLIELATRLFQRRFGNLPIDIALQLRHMSLERLAEFGEALIDFTSVDQARQWLATPKPE